MKYAALLTIAFLNCAICVCADEANHVITLWPDVPPGPPSVTTGEEADTTTDSGQLIAERRVARIGNVAVPRMHVFLPPAEDANGAACLVCPGGGFSILAWDLEGTEVAEWLNGMGVAAIVVRYRVPTRQHGWPKLLEGPVMDTQRALSITRRNATEWKIDTDRIGVLGFSAGGATAAMTAIKAGQRTYERIDETDQQPCDADFCILVYPGAVIDDKSGDLRSEYAITESTPPTLFIHAADDPVNCNNSIALFQAMRAAECSAELHIYNSGGHGYGLRRTAQGVTTWPARATGWLRDLEMIPARPAARTTIDDPTTR